MLSSTAAPAAWPAAGHLHLDERALKALQQPRVSPRSRWSAAMRALGMRRAAHPAFIDARGLWAWSAHEAHAPATRHATLQAWISAHPGDEIVLWVSAQLMNGPSALALLAQQAQHHGAFLRSISPWWSHALQAAVRCVGMLRSAERAAVCIVEGTHIALVTTSRGIATRVEQRRLQSADIASLGWEILRYQGAFDLPVQVMVVLGQGIVDGARTGGLNAVVLGRLDGDQPPQWLRPNVGPDMF
jgi:hypothetical protein